MRFMKTRPLVFKNVDPEVVQNEFAYESLGLQLGSAAVLAASFIWEGEVFLATRRHLRMLIRGLGPSAHHYFSHVAADHHLPEEIKIAVKQWWATDLGLPLRDFLTQVFE